MGGERDVKKDAETTVQDMVVGANKQDLSLAAQDMLKEKAQTNSTEFDRYKAAIDMSLQSARIKGLPSADQLLAMATEANKTPAERQAANGGQKLEVGEKKNPDGSSVVYEKGPDGEVHPALVKHVDGTATKYVYDKNGRVTDTYDQAPDGKGGYKDVRHYHSDDGMTWVKKSGDGPPQLSGTLDVKGDGTHVFKDVNGFTHTIGTDGSSVTKTPQGDVIGKHTCNKDGSSVDQVIQLDGKLHTVKVHHPNGTDTTYAWRPDGKISDIVEYGPGPNGQIDVTRAYHSNDGQQYLKIKGAETDPQIVTGDLNVTDDGKHVFKIAGSPFTVVINPDLTTQTLDPNGQPVKPGQPPAPPGPPVPFP